MKTKSIRLPEDMLDAVKLVEKREHIEEATAIRKLIRVGFEAYVTELYRRGQISLREAAKRLKVSQIEAMDLFLLSGVKGNLDAYDVMESLDRFVSG